MIQDNRKETGRKSTPSDEQGGKVVWKEKEV